MKGACLRLLLLSVLVLAGAACTTEPETAAPSKDEAGKEETLSTTRQLQGYLKQAGEAENLDERIYAFRKALELAPDHPGALLGLGRGYLAKAEGWPNANFIDRIDLRKRALDLLEAAAQAAPQSSAAYSARAAALRAQQKSEEALRGYQKALEIDPENVDAHLGRLWILVGADGAGKGLEACDYALLIAPGEPALHLARASLLKILGRPDEVLPAIERAIELSPESPSGYLQRSFHRRDVGQMQEALADIDRAIELRPDSHHFYDIRASIYTKIGEKELAEADRARSLDLNLDAHYQKALFLPDPAEALAAADRAVELNPWEPTGFVLRGRLLIKQEEAERALQDLERAVDLGPSAMAFTLQAVALGELKKGEAAIASLKRACDEFGECKAYIAAAASVAPLTGRVVDDASGRPVADAIVVLTRRSHHHDPWNGDTAGRFHGRQYAISGPDGTFSMPPLPGGPVLPSLDSRETNTWIEFAVHKDFNHTSTDYADDRQSVTVHVRPGDGVSEGYFLELFERRGKLRVRREDYSRIAGILVGWEELARYPEMQKALAEFRGVGRN